MNDQHTQNISQNSASINIENQESNVNNAESIYHMKSVKFYCQHCRKDFSILNPENNRGTCPRCENVSTTLLSDKSSDQHQRQEQQNHSHANQQTGQSESNAQHPNSQRRSQFNIFTQAIFEPIQNFISQGVASLTGETHQQTNQSQPQNAQQRPQNLGQQIVSGLGNLLGLPHSSGSFHNALDALLGGYPHQPQTRRFPGNPSDLFGDLYSQQQAEPSQQPQQAQRNITFGIGPVQVMFVPVRHHVMFVPGGPSSNDYERLIEEFLRNDPNNYGAAPATQENISKLKEFEYKPEICKNIDCTVCQEDYKKGDKLVSLPCGHNYHKDCVTEWLVRHDSCPVCRKSLNGQNISHTENPQAQQSHSSHANPFRWFF